MAAPLCPFKQLPPCFCTPACLHCRKQACASAPGQTGRPPLTAGKPMLNDLFPLCALLNPDQRKTNPLPCLCTSPRNSAVSLLPAYGLEPISESLRPKPGAPSRLRGAPAVKNEAGAIVGLPSRLRGLCRRAAWMLRQREKLKKALEEEGILV